MDDTDLKILRILQEKARIPNVEVAREIKMAPSAVLERIKKLEAQDIITGYEVILNPDHFHRSMVAYAHVYLSHIASLKETGQLLTELEAVQEVHYLAGEDCLLVKLRVSDTRELEMILSEFIGKIPSVKKMKTFIVLSTYKETSRIPVSMPGDLENS